MSVEFPLIKICSVSGGGGVKLRKLDWIWFQVVWRIVLRIFISIVYSVNYSLICLAHWFYYVAVWNELGEMVVLLSRLLHNHLQLGIRAAHFDSNYLPLLFSLVSWVSSTTFASLHLCQHSFLRSRQLSNYSVICSYSNFAWPSALHSQSVSPCPWQPRLASVSTEMIAWLGTENFEARVSNSDLAGRMKHWLTG